MFFREYSVLLTLALVLLVSIAAVWNTHQREAELHRHEETLRIALLDNAAAAITSALRQQNDILHLFTEEGASHISRVVSEKEQVDEARAWLEARLKARFPNMLNYALADNTGNLLFQGDEFTAGQICRADLRGYAHEVDLMGQAARNKAFIHPRPGEYHYDIMSYYRTRTNQGGILFVSLRPDALAATLAEHRLPGHQLMLVRDSDPALIEITAEGARDQLDRDMRLSADEQPHIADSRQIENTDWRLIDLRSADQGSERTQQLWRETTFLLIGVWILAALLLLMAWRARQHH